MSVKTFDNVRTPNVKNIRKALAGAVFVKRYAGGDPPVTQVWTAEGGLIVPSGYKDVGVLSKASAVKLARDTNTSDVESWGYAQPTRRDITSDVTTVSFTMQESNRLAMELHGGVDLSAVKADAQGNIVVDKPSRPQALDWRVFILCKDGDGADAIYWLDWLPNAQVTGVEDQENSESAEKAYTVTMTGYEDPAIKTAHRQIWGGPGLDVAGMGFLPA
ncbi:hypothetical protein ACTND8_06245 [Atopobiaceae bacterium HCP3S3_F7]|uniref:phage tail tube protein n=2 Tax=Bacteria TaxID=2 RepID=UPI003F88C590